jgi:prepilin-type N-terminal cleavage/methylation domain-containing protein
MTRGRIARRGFTLIEVLIVLILMAGVAAFLTTGNQSLRSAAVEREAIHTIQSVVTSGQVVARKYTASIVVVKIQQDHAWVERDGSVLTPYYETLPPSMTAASASAQAYSDGTLDSNLSTTLTTPEVTYALTIDRSGTVRVQ